MDLNTMLVHVDGSRSADERITFAARLAIAYDAHLVGVTQAGIVRYVYGVGPDMWLGDLPPLFEDMRAEAEKCAARFETLAGQAGVTSFEPASATMSPTWRSRARPCMPTWPSSGNPIRKIRSPRTPRSLTMWPCMRPARSCAALCGTVRYGLPAHHDGSHGPRIVCPMGEAMLDRRRRADK